MIALCKSLNGTWNTSTRTCTPQSLAKTCGDLGGAWDATALKCNLPAAANPNTGGGSLLSISNANQLVQGKTVNLGGSTIHFDKDGYACKGPCDWVDAHTEKRCLPGGFYCTDVPVPRTLKNPAASPVNCSLGSNAPLCCTNYGLAYPCNVTAAQMAQNGFLNSSGITNYTQKCIQYQALPGGGVGSCQVYQTLPVVSVWN